MARARRVRRAISLPRSPVSATSRARTDLLERPPGCPEVLFDTGHVGLSGITTKGLAYSHTGGNSVTITSVDIDGTNIVITLSATPTGTSKTVSRAPKRHWQRRMGDGAWPVHTPDSRESVFYRCRRAVHPNPRHYLVRFGERVA
jgi:hypothetical protein